MLLTLLYHRILPQNMLHKNGNPIDLMEKHLSFLALHYPLVVPGESLSSPAPLSSETSYLTKSKKHLHICLTFDDATFDFYHYIFPLLKKHQIKAVLSVPVGEIVEASSLPSCLSKEERLKSCDQSRFCTWQELQEMAKSGFIHIASHSYSHKSLLSKDINLSLEIVESKKILEEKLKIPIMTFVYPLGKFSSSIHKLVKEHYPYVMRIGSAININWQNASGMLYRIVCDAMNNEKAPLHWKNFPAYFWFLALNTFRCR